METSSPTRYMNTPLVSLVLAFRRALKPMLYNRRHHDRRRPYVVVHTSSFTLRRLHFAGFMFSLTHCRLPIVCDTWRATNAIRKARTHSHTRTYLKPGSMETTVHRSLPKSNHLLAHKLALAEKHPVLVPGAILLVDAIAQPLRELLPALPHVGLELICSSRR